MHLPADYVTAMVAGIVAFESDIGRVQPKVKLSQNRDRKDRHNVAERLEAMARNDARAVAALLAE